MLLTLFQHFRGRSLEFPDQGFDDGGFEIRMGPNHDRSSQNVEGLHVHINIHPAWGTAAHRRLCGSPSAPLLSEGVLCPCQ